MEFFPTYSFASQAAEVEVNRDTGVVSVLNIAAATDVEKPSIQ